MMKRRHLVLALVALLSCLTFLDRILIAVVGPAVQRQFSISAVHWGWIFRLRGGLQRIRDSVRSPGRQARLPARADPHLPLVVGVRRAHGLLPHGLAVHRRQVFLRPRRRGGLSQPDGGALSVDAGRRARPQPGSVVVRRAAWEAGWRRCCWCHSSWRSDGTPCSCCSAAWASYGPRFGAGSSRSIRRSSRVFQRPSSRKLARYR